LSDFNETLIFSADFRKKILKYQVLSISVQCQLRCSMGTDWKDGDAPNSRLSQFCEGTQKWKSWTCKPCIRLFWGM